MNANHFDVIVVGAGPAGATAAFQLANAGARNLLIEKQKLPRHKTCGGGVTHKVAQALGCDLASVVERTITEVVLTFKMGRPRVLGSPDPIVYMVRRSEFDHLLTQRAVANGAQLLDDTAVLDLSTERHQTVFTAHGTFISDFVIGADGATGVTARALGLMSDRVLLPAVEHEVEVSPQATAYWADKMSLDLGTLRASYGWIFPKADHLNVGVGGFGPHGDFARYLKRYDRAHLDRRVPKHASVRNTFGSVLPLRRKNAPIQKGRAMLIGDAAGLVEALTGEGIYYAVRSGQICARTILTNAYPDYETQIGQELMPDLLTARQSAAFYRWLPPLCYVCALYWPGAWQILCDVLRGEYRFREVNRHLGLLGWLWDLLPTYA
jgi:geranylgeranyl reductase family protein